MRQTHGAQRAPLQLHMSSRNRPVRSCSLHILGFKERCYAVEGCDSRSSFFCINLKASCIAASWANLIRGVDTVGLPEESLTQITMQNIDEVNMGSTGDGSAWKNGRTSRSCVIRCGKRNTIELLAIRTSRKDGTGKLDVVVRRGDCFGDEGQKEAGRRQRTKPTGIHFRNDLDPVRCDSTFSSNLSVQSLLETDAGRGGEGN